MGVVTNSKLAVIGAGAVGTSVAYASLIRGSAREIALYDVNAAKAEAEVLDLAHGTQFTGSSTVYGGGDISAVEGANVVVITAGAKQNPGQSRLDLASTNVGILRDIMPALVERAPDAVFLLVTNPCDILAKAALEFSGLPANRVFSSGTVLDSSRLRWMLSQRTGVATSSIHAYIVGEHGDSEFPLWSQARIGPMPVTSWRDATGTAIPAGELDDIAESVKTAAYTVIAGKGATNYAIGLSGARIVEAILSDEGAVLPVSSVLTDFHGVTDIALSVPSVVNSTGVATVLDVEFDDRELELFHRSAQALADASKALGLV